MTATAVIGRDEELRSIEAFLGEIESGPAALVLSGEPGIGKTLLWEAGVREARRRCGTVLVHRSVEAEALLSFAGLSDLLAPVFEDLAPSLAPLRRRALEVALLLAEPGEVQPDPRAIGLALLDLLRALAAHGPVVVALDDVQWLDPSSAMVLPLALRRVGDEPVRTLATGRKVQGVPAPMILEHAFPEERFQRIWLRPLALGALRQLLAERLGVEPTRGELAQIQATSGGNPFFALELGRELMQADATRAAGRALRVPESLRDLLGERLARLPAETAEVLIHVAALARPTVELITAAHGDRRAVLDALDIAVREGVLELDDSRPRFANPLLASICYEQAPIWKRRAVHEALAAAVADLEERARHLALAAEGPHAAVAAELDAAAEHAAGRGATAAAAELCELAAGLTPDDPARWRQRRLHAARFHRLAGDFPLTATLLEELLTQVPPGLERADVLFELASTQRADPATTIALCDEAMVEAAGDDARLARILGYRGWIRLFQADVHGALADARAALERAERVGDPALITIAIGHVATAEGRAAEFTPGLLERGVELEERLGLVLEYNQSPRMALSRRLIAVGDLDRSRRILREIAAQAAARGDELLRGQVIGSVARIEWFAGNYERALDQAALSHELQTQTGSPHAVAITGRLRALSEADIGLVEEARASAAQALARSEALADREWTILTHGVLGRLELVLGNVDAALGHLRELPARLISLGYRDPTAPLWADAIEALITAGELEQARAYLDLHAEHATRVGSRWAIAGSLRCRGLLAAAQGDLPAAFAALERALGELEGLPFPLERGRTLLALGIVRRQAQQKKAARAAFEQARALFEELGAGLWAQKARTELARVSGRQPASDELTGTERRVASLAAQGRSNKEIASALFMGVSTVEAHLSRVYRKLGVRSRTELASRTDVRGAPS
jgi:DNA-binding CsgD family transcriptional regulator